MGTILRWTSADLEGLPDDGKHYEIIDRELTWSEQEKAGDGDALQA